MIDERFPLVVDISDWQGAIPVSEVQTWQANNVQGVILRAHSESYCVETSAQLKLLGLPTLGIYLQPEWLRPAAGIPESYFTVDSLIRRCNQLQTQTAIIDSEGFYDAQMKEIPVDGAVAYGMIVAAVDRLKREGLQPVNYTNAGWWRGALGDPTLLPDCPLWHSAYWDDLHAVETVTYGGGAKAWAHQFTSTPPAPFRPSLDLSYAYFLMEDAPMSPAERARMERLERLIAANGIRNPETGETLTGEAALAYLDGEGVSAFLGLHNTNQALSALIDEVDHEPRAAHSHPLTINGIQVRTGVA